MYVVEVNINSGIKVGDELEFIDEPETVMKVLAPDGSTQMELYGGERIVSRRETKILIRKAKKAYDSKSDRDYKSLGKYMFKVLKRQDSRDPEYVKSPK
jgi:bifunctional DNA-binding transcriptional regulator/antitoxin component of YhaV-PrlF toxin-antitoxin module